MAIIEHIVTSAFFSHWAYWITFLASIFEVFPLFGFFIPGQTFVLIGGFLAKLDILNIWKVIFVSAFGAIIGDMMSYLLGKRYGYRFISKYGKYVFFKRTNFLNVRRMIRKHTGKTLIIARSSPFTRSITPFLAGSSNIGFLKVFTFCLIGSIGWAIFFSVLGYILGASYEIASKSLDIATLIIFFLVILGFYIYQKRQKKIVI